MAEENTQDMAMEDILSSIKNILEEDQATEQPVAKMDFVTDEADDVLELSEDMRLPNVETLTSEINLDEELDEVKIPELDITENTISNEDNNLNFEANEDNPISELLNDPETNFIENVVSPAEITDVVNQEEYLHEDFSNSFEDTENIVDTFEPTIAEEIIPQEEFVEIEKTTVENTIAEPIVEDIIPEVASPVVQENVVYETVEPIVQEESVAEEIVNETNNNAVDASANIISNFAKMFAKEEAAAKQSTPASIENKINLLGDGSKTIEDIVCSVIRQIIADEVVANWQKSADYESFAKQEISAYTQKWIDKNLPIVVEKIVKQEIERVMAKAGNNQ